MPIYNNAGLNEYYEEEAKYIGAIVSTYIYKEMKNSFVLILGLFRC